MAYTPTEWESADVVTAVRMNALENAVGDIDMSYTPNVWSDGDILTADKMNALEQAVASGGGGGSSDFSTATLTISSEYIVDAYIPQLVEANTIVEGQPAFISTYVADAGGTYEVLLYKGAAYVQVYSDYSASASGDIEDMGEHFYLITGDCTITISNNGGGGGNYY